MKKIYLCFLTVSISLSVNAQTYRWLNHVHNYVKDDVVNDVSEDVSNQQLAPYKPNNQTAKTTAVSTIDAGHSSNPYGYYASVKSNIWAHPPSGLVAHVHRTDPAITGSANSGFLYTSFSKNFGTTWTQDAGPAYSNDAGTGAQGPNFSVVRFPQTALYNPYQGSAAENIPDSTYICFTSASRTAKNPDATTGDWGSHSYGVYKPTGSIKKQHQINTDSINGKRFFVIPDDYHATQNGHTWTIDIGGYQKKKNHYQDTIYLDYGTWSPSQHDFVVTTKKIYAPVTRTFMKDHIINSKIAFAPDGMNGWISLLGHDSFSFQSDSLYYPILYHTIDGGNSWSGPIRVDLDNIPGLTNSNDSLFIPGGSPATYRHVIGFRHDLAVDYMGRPHLILNMGIIDYDPLVNSWTTTRAGAVVTITADANGNSFSGKFLAWPMSFWSCYGDCDPLGQTYLTDYNRTQIATTWDGKNIIYAWADADTNLFATINSTYAFNMQNPDIWAAAQDLTTGNMSVNPSTNAQSLSISTVAKNITKQTAADAQAAYFNLSYYVFQPTVGVLDFELPIAYSEFDISTSGAALASASTTHKYLKGATLSINNPVGIAKTNAANDLSVFPNPTNATLTINYSLQQQTNVLIELYNIVGEKLETVNSKNETQGIHSLTLDMSKYAQGTYIVKSSINGITKTNRVTKL